MNALILNIPQNIQLTDEQFFKVCQVNRDLRFERSATVDLIIMLPDPANLSGEDVLPGFILNMEFVW